MQHAFQHPIFIAAGDEWTLALERTGLFSVMRHDRETMASIEAFEAGRADFFQMRGPVVSSETVHAILGKARGLGISDTSFRELNLACVWAWCLDEPAARVRQFFGVDWSRHKEAVSAFEVLIEAMSQADGKPIQ